MLKNIVQLEHIIGERVFHFMCDPSSPLNEIKDALVKFLQYIGQVEDEAKAKQEEEFKSEITDENPKE